MLEYHTIFGETERKKIERFVKKGLSQSEIGRKIGVSREVIRTYILRSGLRETWEKSNFYYNLSKQRNREKKQNVLEKIAGQVQLVVQKRADESGRFAYDKTMEYMESVDCRYSFDLLYDLFCEVDRIRQKKKKVPIKKLRQEASLKAIGNKFGLTAASVGRVLKTVKIKPFYGTRKFRKFSSFQEEALKRGFHLKISFDDLGFFTGVPSRVVSSRYRENPNGRNYERSKLLVADFGRNGKLTKRLASQIYFLSEVHGLDGDSVINRLGITRDVYDHAVIYRKEIEAEIVRDLKVIYDDPKIRKPFNDYCKV